MRAELSKLHMRLQTTVIYVTHDQTSYDDRRIVVMKDGLISRSAHLWRFGNPDNMFVADLSVPPMSSQTLCWSRRVTTSMSRVPASS